MLKINAYSHSIWYNLVKICYIDLRCFKININFISILKYLFAFILSVIIVKIFIFIVGYRNSDNIAFVSAIIFTIIACTIYLTEKINKD